MYYDQSKNKNINFYKQLKLQANEKGYNILSIIILKLIIKKPNFKLS